MLTRLQRKGVITVTHTQDALYSVYILQNRNNEDHRMIQTSKKTRNSVSPVSQKVRIETALLFLLLYEVVEQP